MPGPALLRRVKAAGAIVIASATIVKEAIWLEEHGADAIIAQGADDSLVVGDSHHYGAAADLAEEEVYGLILEEFRAVTGREAPPVRARWTGTYAAASDRTLLIESPQPRVRLVVVTSGVGASTGFAIGEEVIGELFGQDRDA